jgi:hypothetical protein
MYDKLTTLGTFDENERPMGPKGFWEVKASRLHASALEGGRLSVIHTGRLYPQGKRKVMKLN